MPRTILFVCTGNTCRSPMAEGIARHLIGQGLLGPPEGWAVGSAGTNATDGLPATPEAIEALRAMHIDIRNHRSRALTRAILDWGSIIYGMTSGHLNALNALAPASKDRLYLIDPTGEINDPFGSDQATYDETAQRLLRIIRERLEELTA